MELIDGFALSPSAVMSVAFWWSQILSGVKSQRQQIETLRSVCDRPEDYNKHRFKCSFMPAALIDSPWVCQMIISAFLGDYVGKWSAERAARRRASDTLAFFGGFSPPLCERRAVTAALLLRVSGPYRHATLHLH